MLNHSNLGKPKNDATTLRTEHDAHEHDDLTRVKIMLVLIFPKTMPPLYKINLLKPFKSHVK